MTPAGVVLDLDGVLLAAGAPIPGAADAVARVAGGGSSLRRPHEHDLGLARRSSRRASPTPASTSRPSASSRPPSRRPRSLRTSHAGARVLLLAERGSEREFAGCRLVDGPPADLVVVGGPDDSWTLSLLDDALRALQGGARLIAMQGNAWWLAADGPRLDSGSYVRSLAYAAGVRPRVIGKPSAAIFRTRVPRARTCRRPPA